jgi:creatinine amidohydrolase
MNWMDVERYLQSDDRIILITGATEQHAYLSLLTDILIPQQIASAVIEQEPVILAPPLNFGLSALFTAFPGTISISQTAFDLILTEMVQSLLYQGFGGFLILNGHSQNSLPASLNELMMEGHARITWYDWWRGPAAQDFEATYNLRIDHANWGENFAFTRVSDVPTGEKPLVNLGYLEDGEPVRSLLGDGSYGGAYQVDESLTTQLLERVVTEAVGELRALVAPAV